MAASSMSRNVKLCKLYNIVYAGRAGRQGTHILNNPRLFSNEPSAQDDNTEQDDMISKMRDVSRMASFRADSMEHRRRVPQTPEDGGGYNYPKSRKYQRKLYAEHGKDSGIDPGLMWPSKQELEQMRAEEPELEPSLQDLWARLKERKEGEREAFRIKEERVQAQMAKMPQYIEEFRARIAKETDAEKAQEEKRKALLEEARDYFGYYVDPREQRFKDMMERKAEEAKKARRLKKKEEKEQRIVARFNITDAADKSKIEDGESKPES